MPENWTPSGVREGKLATPPRTVMHALSQVDAWIGPHGVPGVGVAVWRRGEIVAEQYVGEARPGVSVTHETLVPARFGDETGYRRGLHVAGR